MYGVGCRLLWGRAEVFCKAVITAVSVIFAHARVLEHRTELAMLQVRDKDQSSSETQFFFFSYPMDHIIPQLL